MKVMFSRALLATLTAVSFAAACKSASGGAGASGSAPAGNVPAGNVPAGNAASRSVPFERLHSGVNSGYTQLSEFVLQDDLELTRRWRGVLQGSPEATKPNVNFDKSTVVLVAIGARNTGGHSVHIDSVLTTATATRPGITTVFYTVTSPGARCMSMQMLTSPIEVISLDRVQGEVRFRKKSVAGPC